MPEYRLEIDLNRDGQYGLSAPDADLTASVTALAWREGMAASFDDVAAPAELRVTLINDGAFDPENESATYAGRLVPGLLVRLQADDGVQTHTLFIGRLKRIVVSPAAFGVRGVVLVVQDFLLELLDAEYAPPLLLDATIDEALRPLFEQPVVPWPYAGRFWMLETGASSVLDSGTRLYEDTATAFEVGRTRLTFAGDNLDRGEGVSAQGAIRDLMAAEAGGRFFWQAQTGRFVFHNRAHDTLNDTLSGVFNGSEFTPEGTVYSFGDTVINALTVTYQPREVGDTTRVLWSAPGLPLLLAPGGSLTLDARYRDPDTPSALVGARDVIRPAAYADYVASGTAGGSGDRTGFLAVSIRPGAGRAVVRLVNTDTVNALYVQALQLRGTPLVAQPALQARVQDAASIAAYERHEPQPLQLRAVDDGEFATQIARFLVSRFAQPLARFAAVRFAAHLSDTLMQHALARRVGDKITITNARLGHDADYVIVGQRHEVRAGGDQPHHVTWVLAPLSRTTYWRMSDGAAWVAYSRLDETTRLML
jgi:hypothetical protein